MTEPNPMNVDCPTCKAGIEWSCRDATGRPRSPHPARIEAALAFAAVAALPEIPAPMTVAERAAILDAADAGRTRVVYLACPVAATPETIRREIADSDGWYDPDAEQAEVAAAFAVVGANLRRAGRWLWWLRCHTAWSVCAPWIPAVQASIDHGADEATERARGLADDRAVLERCDAIVLCGGRVSAGMAIERAHAEAHGLAVIDLSMCGAEPGGAAAGLITGEIPVRWRRG